MRNNDYHTIMLEDARIIFRNFSGREQRFNPPGSRNFCVLLDEDLAEHMLKDGWNIKSLKALDENEPDQPYLQVSVGFKGRPPKIVMITSRGRTDLGEEECELLDWVDVKMVDLIIRPYDWEFNGKSGRKAMLKSIFITIEEDPFDLKYAGIPDADSGPVEEEG